MASNYPREQVPRSSAIPSAKAMPSTSASIAKDPSSQLPTLYANHFTCQFGKDLPLYQYDVEIESLNTSSGRWFEVKGRSRCALIMQSFIAAGVFTPQVTVWYDEQKCLYSTSVIPTPQLHTSEDGQSRLNIKSLANQWSTNDIDRYVTSQTNAYPHDAVRILETLLKKSLQGRVEVVNNTCYFIDQPPQKLPGGFEERAGFIQALNLAANRVTLNVQTKLTTFYPSMPLLDFIHLQTGQRRIPNENERKKLTQILKGCLVVTQQSNWKQAYEIVQFTSQLPVEITIESGETLVEYYNTAKGITLKQLNYPCVLAQIPNTDKSPVHLPLELCQIRAWQVYDTMPSKAHGAQQPRKQIPRPSERYNAIMEMLQKCDFNDPSNALCRTVSFRIDDQEMLKFNARVLTQPTIHSGENSFARVRIGRISLDGQLFTPKPLSALAITYFGCNLKQDAPAMKSFAETLLGVMEEYHIGVSYRKYDVEPTSEKITDFFRRMHEEKCQFAVCVMTGGNDDELKQLKANIKNCATIQYGIMTQCVLLSRIADNRSLRTYCENLIRKINFKNSGINTKLVVNKALKGKMSETDSYMFFGADVIHPTNVTRQHPSIAAVVGSGDSLCSTTAVRVCKQYPKEGKCSIETVLGLAEMVEQLLHYNQQANKVLPNKIVFYRDGVDDGQFRKVIDQEIPAIRQAFNVLYGDTSKHPKLTFLVVKKRHHTRFFTYNEGTEQTNNLPVGTVVDTTIVHPQANCFHLNSHNAFQGVNHPSLYHILLDEIGFTADELQLLTYHLCFTDPRSSASEAIPSVVHHADIAALKARDLFYDDDSSSVGSVRGRYQALQNPTPNDLTYEILDVHESLKDRPIFG